MNEAARQQEADKAVAKLKVAILRGDMDVLAKMLGLSLQPFHRRILAFCKHLYTHRAEGLLLAPRGFGKSSLATVCFALWLMLRDRDIRILIASSTAGKAESFVREIKNHLRTNSQLLALFGDLADESCWRRNEISLRGRARKSKEATLTARGWSGAVVGLHFDVHLIDDLVNEDNARTKGQRDKLKDWVHMSLDPTLEPHGCRLVTGTRYHPDDFYGHCVTLFAKPFGDTSVASSCRPRESGDPDQNVHSLPSTHHQHPPPGLDSRFHGNDKADGKPGDQNATGDPAPSLSPAQDDEAGEGTRWQASKGTLSLRLQALQPDGASLWPDKFPARWLKRKRERMGLIRFNAQYQNDCELMHGKVFRQADVRHYHRADVDVGELTIVQGVDVAVGQGDRHDYFALVTKGYDDQGNAYTLDVVRGRYTFQQQMIVILYKSGHTPRQIARLLGTDAMSLPIQEGVRALFEDQPTAAKMQYPNVARIGIEAVAYQRVLPQRLFELAPTLPLVCVPQRLDKRSRMTVYAARWESHREFFPSDNSCDALTEELLLFPDAPHDDLIDAHEIAHRVAEPLLYQDDEQEDTEARVFA
ncbi:MAG: hypothetical protein AAF471_05455 [Myxococcota bacterium]